MIGQTPAAAAPDRPAHSFASIHRRGLWAAVVGGVAGGLLFLVAHAGMADDAYITLSYARNLAEHGQWGVLPDRPANTATSPLNVWLLAAGIVVTGQPVVAVGVLLVGCLALVGGWGARLAGVLRVPWWWAVLLVGLLVTSPVLVSSVGLETYLEVTVLLGVARYAVVGRPALTGVLCGVAVLARPDLAVPAGVLAAGVLWHRETGQDGQGPGHRYEFRLFTVALVAALVALPWHLFAWWQLGGFVPDTFLLKTQPGVWNATLVTAPAKFYLGVYPVATTVTVLAVGAGVACAVWALRHHRERRAQVAIVFTVAGWAHFAALDVLGAFPETWYYAPLVACSFVALALTTPRLGRVVPAGVIALITGCAVANIATTGAVPWTATPMYMNYAHSGQYAAIATQLAPLTDGPCVGSPGEIGVLAFFSKVPVLDGYGDLAAARAALERRYDHAGPVMRTLLRWNWAHRPDPPLLTPRYQLTFESLTRTPGRVIRSWPVDSPVRGPDRLVLTESVRPPHADPRQTEHC